MLNKLILFTAIALLFSAGCNQTRTGTSEVSRDQSVNRRSQSVDLQPQGLIRVGDSPPFDSPALTIQCVDEQTCWINSPRILWQSLDGGKTWQEINRAPKDEDVQSFDFIDGKKGWLIRFDKLYKSEDGGRNWAYRTSPMENLDGDMRSLSFPKDGDIGWLAGGQYRPQTPEELKSGVPNNTKDLSGKRVLEEAIFRTNDIGQTWEKQFASGSWGRIMLIKAINKDQALALGEHNVYFTANGGKNWQRSTFRKNCVAKDFFTEEYEATPVSPFLLDSNTWWLAYGDGRVVKSVDAGRTWCDLVLPRTVMFEDENSIPQYFTNMHFENSDHGWALGWDRFLYESKDGGKHWVRVTSEIRFDSMTFWNRGNGLLISKVGVFRVQQ
jgi:photosystem II stability/assembly factor-like uncharacterized protein